MGGGENGRGGRLKIIAGADSFGCSLKEALVDHMSSLLDIEVEDLGTGSYYSIAAEVGRRVSEAEEEFSTSRETRGVVACGTGVGVSIFANKFPGVYAATCLTPADAQNARSINHCNVLALSGFSTSTDSAIDIFNTWIQTSFKAPCPASGSITWPPDIQSFLDDSLRQIPLVGAHPLKLGSSKTCTICCLARDMEFGPVDIMPGGSMKIVRESPTSAVVKFKAGSVEPAHHHTFGHDLLLVKGRKSVWNLTKSERHDLVTGDYLFTPAGDVHRVKYYEDTEFFITWDGKWDIFLDEDLPAAHAAIVEAGHT